VQIRPFRVLTAGRLTCTFHVKQYPGRKAIRSTSSGAVGPVLGNDKRFDASSRFRLGVPEDAACISLSIVCAPTQSARRRTAAQGFNGRREN